MKKTRILFLISFMIVFGASLTQAIAQKAESIIPFQTNANEIS